MLLQLEQRTQAWHDWRNGVDVGGVPRITATAASAIMGLSPFATASQLWEEMVGLRGPKQMNRFMKKGVEFEDEAREALERRIGVKFTSVCCEMDSNPEFAASLDGINDSTTMLCEIKVPGQKTLTLAANGQIPVYYQDQMQWQMACAGPQATLNIYWAYDTQQKVGYPVILERDDRRIEIMMAMATKFRQSVIDRTPPGGLDLELIAYDLSALLHEEVALKEKIDAKRIELLNVFDELGMKEARTGGLAISRVAGRAGSVSWQAVAQLLGTATQEQIESCRGAATAPSTRIELIGTRAKSKAKANPKSGQQGLASDASVNVARMFMLAP